jgi:uncharacterized membrane protein
MANLEIRDKTRLKRIASNQRGLLVCVLLMVLLSIVSAFDKYNGSETSIFGEAMEMIPVYVYYLVNIVGFIFLILMAANAYNSVIMAVVLGLLCFIPCIGILILLGANQQATRLLRANGYKVGFWGAKMNQFN